MMELDRFSDRNGIAPDVGTFIYADRWLRENRRDRARLRAPRLPYFRDPHSELWLPWHMAVALDATSQGASTTGTSLAWNHTVAGSDRILIAAFLSNGTISATTADGVAMTLIDSIQFTPNPAYFNYLYRLIAPATGTISIQMTVSSSAVICGVAASYTGAKQSGQPDNTAKANGTTTTNYAQSLTPNADNCWIVEVAQNDNGSPTAVSGCVQRVAALGQNFALFDTNGAISPAANTTLTVTMGGSATWSSVMASIAPAVPFSPHRMFAVFP